MSSSTIVALNPTATSPLARMRMMRFTASWQVLVPGGGGFPGILQSA